MSERGADFDAKREAYEAARGELARIIDNPHEAASTDVFRARIRKARAASKRAHEAMLAAWS